MTQPAVRASPLVPGYRLDRYELLCPVGEGGMASVWVARLTRKHGFEKLVAIKTILPKYAEDETFQKMFLDEARIASRIDHANVAHIHDLGEEDNILYLVMEWIDGDALTRLRRAILKAGHPFPPDVALRIIADVCAGLHAAHELRGNDGGPLGVVHRDVSPQNILINIEGVAKLIDFGVAKAAHRLVEETNTGFVKGKVQYMAPEQALGHVVDRRADCWAVGAVLYHLLANRPPFEADNQLAMLHVLTRGNRPAPLPPTIAGAVSDVVFKALTHDREQRFQSAAEMRNAIERTGLAATTDQVADCLRMYLGEQAEARRHALAVALHTSGARAQMSANPSSAGQRAAPASTGSDSGTQPPLNPIVQTPPQPLNPPLVRPTPQALKIAERAIPRDPTIEHQAMHEDPWLSFTGPKIPAAHAAALAGQGSGSDAAPNPTATVDPTLASAGPPVAREAAGATPRAQSSPRLPPPPPPSVRNVKPSSPKLPPPEAKDGGGDDDDGSGDETAALTPPPNGFAAPTDRQLTHRSTLQLRPNGSVPDAPTEPLPNVPPESYTKEGYVEAFSGPLDEAFYEQKTELMVTPPINSPPSEPITGGSLGLASISSSVGTQAPKKSRRGLMIATAAVLALLLVLGMGGGFVIDRYRSSAAHTPTFAPTFSPLPSSAAVDPIQAQQQQQQQQQPSSPSSALTAPEQPSPSPTSTTASTSTATTAAPKSTDTAKAVTTTTTPAPVRSARPTTTTTTTAHLSTAPSASAKKKKLPESPDGF